MLVYNYRPGQASKPNTTNVRQRASACSAASRGSVSCRPREESLTDPADTEPVLHAAVGPLRTILLQEPAVCVHTLPTPLRDLDQKPRAVETTRTHCPLRPELLRSRRKVGTADIQRRRQGGLRNARIVGPCFAPRIASI